MSDKKTCRHSWTGVFACTECGDLLVNEASGLRGSMVGRLDALRDRAALTDDLARALLSVEWEDYSGRCPWCSAIRGADHRADCERQSALRKAGVIK